MASNKYIKKIRESNHFKVEFHTLQALISSSHTLLIRFLGVLCMFLVSVILGRTIGAEGLGIINLSYQLVNVIVIISMLGINTVLVKEISISHATKDYQNIANVVNSALKLTIPFGIVFSFIGILTSQYITEVFFNEPKLRLPLIIALGIITPEIILKMFCSGINGYSKIWQSNLIQLPLQFFIILVGLGGMFLINIELTILNVAGLYGISKIISSLSAVIYWNKLFSFKGVRNNVYRKLLGIGLPLLVVSSSALIANNADVIMLGWLSNSREVGLYSVAAQLGHLIIIFHAVTASVMSPRIAVLYAEKNIEALKNLVQNITSYLIVIGALSVCVFVFIGEHILGLWGSEFVNAHSLLIVLCVGQFFNIATGATGLILMMTGHERIVGKISMYSLLLNLLLNYALILQFGALGAAIATAITFIFENTLKIVAVKSRIGIWTISLLDKISYND